jgi:hypothetical protein
MAILATTQLERYLHLSPIAKLGYRNDRRLPRGGEVSYTIDMYHQASANIVDRYQASKNVPVAERTRSGTQAQRILLRACTALLLVILFHNQAARSLQSTQLYTLDLLRSYALSSHTHQAHRLALCICNTS